MLFVLFSLRSTILFVLFSISTFCFAETKSTKSSPHSIQNFDIPDIKLAEVCLLSTRDAYEDQMDWIITCMDKTRKFVVKEKRIGGEKVAGEDELTFGDMEVTVEMQNRGFRLVSTQDGLFFTRK
jgi:hypothetical protein